MNVIEALRAYSDMHNARGSDGPCDCAACRTLDALVKPCPGCKDGLIVGGCALCNGTGEVTVFDRLEAAEAMGDYANELHHNWNDPDYIPSRWSDKAWRWKALKEAFDE